MLFTSIWAVNVPGAGANHSHTQPPSILGGKNINRCFAARWVAVAKGKNENAQKMEKLDSVGGSYAAAGVARVKHAKSCSQNGEAVARGILNDKAWREISDSLGFTHREVQIVKGVFRNLKNAAIAGWLSISSHTVHIHLNRLYKKLRVTTRTELVVRIFEELWVLTERDGSPLAPICQHRMHGRCRAGRCRGIHYGV
jgi:DNA-binding CsgD family transcriptional regulator